MAIRASSSRQIDALIADLGSPSAVTQETAVARLAVLGARAVERLLAAAATDPDVTTRAGAWRALEAIGDTRALEPALTLLAAADLDPALGVPAAGIARAHLRGAHGAVVLDRLATVLLDRTRNEAVRLAALRALRELDAATIAPILAELSHDPNPAVRTEAGLRDGGAPRGPDDPAAAVSRAAEGRLPDDPAVLRHALNLAGASLPPEALLKVVERVREREGAEPAAVRDQWRLARAAAHLALASRDSRIALYDLRESLESAKGPVPGEFLTALKLIGDASCLEAIAGAHAKSKDAWWRSHLADAFYEIVQRERLTSRHAVMKKIQKRWPGAWPGAQPAP